MPLRDAHRRRSPSRLRFTSLLPSLTAALSTGQRQRVAARRGAAARAGVVVSRRAHRRRGPRRPPAVLGPHLRAGRRSRDDRARHHALHGRGRAVRPARLHPRWPHHRRWRRRPTLKSGLAGRLFQVRASGDPFEALAAVCAHPSLEDAYLFGRRLRAVAREGESAGARAALGALGAVTGTDPSLEDVFVSLARRQARPVDKVTV